tara:strand:- start:322 stop:849 length:528 start_codon:yes stop_codon:yes gene_type:complete
MKISRVWFLRVVLFFFCWVSVQNITLAHGGGEEQIKLREAGPYILTVWTSSQDLSGDLHVTVAVSDLENNLILDASVIVTIGFENGDILSIREATTLQSSNKFRYETDFKDVESGVYQVTVIVDRTDQKGVVSFKMEHDYEENVKYNITYPLIVSLVLLSLFGLFVYRRRLTLNQ